jgi:hypothetical protein
MTKLADFFTILFKGVNGAKCEYKRKKFADFISSCQLSRVACFVMKTNCRVDRFEESAEKSLPNQKTSIPFAKRDKRGPESVPYLAALILHSHEGVMHRNNNHRSAKNSDSSNRTKSSNSSRMGRESGNLKNGLVHMRVVQRNLVYVIGLSPFLAVSLELIFDLFCEKDFVC